jgi:hypothetical protein
VKDQRLARGRRYFEYHCYEGEDSCDAELWHHTHQEVEVLGSVKDVDERMYCVQFSDGFQYDVFDDELVASPADYARPDYQKATA